MDEQATITEPVLRELIGAQMPLSFVFVRSADDARKFECLVRIGEATKALVGQRKRPRRFRAETAIKFVEDLGLKVESFEVNQAPGQS